MYTNLDTFNNKRTELQARISIVSPDIIGITEVNPKSAKWTLNHADLQVQGYSLFADLGRRGVALYVKESMRTCEIIPKDPCDDTVWCEIRINNKERLLVGVVYRSPSSTEEDNRKLISLINEMACMKHKSLLIMGDFNYPDIDWATLTADEGRQAVEFLENCREWFLCQHVMKPTRYRTQQTANVLDLVFTNEESMINEIKYEEPIGKSDHLCLVWSLKSDVLGSDTAVVKYLFSKGDFQAMRRELAGEPWEELLIDKPVDEQWNIIKDRIHMARDKFIPHNNYRGGAKSAGKPKWMDERVMARIRRKKTAFERYKETRDGKDYLEYTRARNAAKAETRRAVREYEKEIARLCKKNPKAFYRHVNSKIKTRIGISDIRSNQGVMINDDQQKADEFNKFFSSVFTLEDLQNVPSTKVSGVKETLHQVEINEFEVFNLLSNLQTEKSPGPDNVHPMILKECANELARPLTILFQTSEREGCIPQEWKEALVVPIFKKGSRAQVGNYRPVSLTSVCCKIMEKLMRRALISHMLDNKFLSDNQHGFIQGRSCTTQLLKVVDRLTEILDKGGTADMVYLDFAKAFDTVPHKRLLVKLEGYGVEGRTLKWIEQFLVGRRQRVGVAGSFSEWSEVVSGVPQGSVLGPVLFVCYINDLPEAISSIIHMYADDTKLFRQVDDEIDRKKLQEDLDRLALWANEWQLKFNVEKCKVMHIGLKNEKVKLTMSDGTKRSELQETELEKDLGIWFNNKLTSQDQVTLAVNKANQILGLIRRSFTYMDAQLMKQLFTTMVRPHLEYGNVVWHPYLRKEIDMIEAVQRRATKMVPGFSNLTYEQRLRKMKLPSLEYRRFRGDMIEAYKYMHGLYRVDESALLPRHHDTGVTTRGHCMKLAKRESSTMIRQNFFGLRIVNRWNGLPEKVVLSSSVNVFKGRLDRHCGEECYDLDVKWSVGRRSAD